jgi:P-type E1-E2 ATPase
VLGEVDAHTVAVGARTFVANQLGQPDRAAMLAQPHPEGLTAFVAVDGRFAGTVAYADALRKGVTEVLGELTELGVRRIVLLSGDAERNARAVAASVGIKEVRGDLLPADKVDTVRALTAEGRSVLMIGDGTNDAPALSAATVGIALAGHGGGVSAEAADVIILVDDLSRVIRALRISHRTMRIARQSVWAGLTLSGIAMIVAAFGYITPIAGALLQEVIDIGVILNALRASVAPRSTGVPVSQALPLRTGGDAIVGG